MYHLFKNQSPQSFALIAACVTPAIATYKFVGHDNRDLDLTEIEHARRSLNALSCPNTQVANETKTIYSKSVETKRMATLALHGVTVCKSILSSKDIESWNAIINEQLQIPGACIRPIRGAKGRLHCFPPKLARKHQQSQLDQKHSYSWVDDLIKLGGGKKRRYGKNIASKSDSPPSELGAIAKEYFLYHSINEENYGITDIQMLVAENLSEHQIWHRDNAAGPGLTALIALKDVTTNGPTEILLGSHNSLQSRKEKSVIEELKSNGISPEISSNILLATLEAGDAIIYDARLLHRGRGYNSGASDRPVLVVRWDAHDTPPPGTGFIGTQFAQLLGTCLIAFQTVKKYIKEASH